MSKDNKEVITYEESVIGDLKDTFRKASLDNQQKAKFSVKEILGAISLAYYRGKQQPSSEGSGEVGLRWVKASDDLPAFESDTKVSARLSLLVYNKPNSGRYLEGKEKQYFATDNFQIIYKDDFENVQWLQYTLPLNSNVEGRRFTLDLINELEEYFDNKADADHDETGHVPNREMQLLTKIRELINTK